MKDSFFFKQESWGRAPRFGRIIVVAVLAIFAIVTIFLSFTTVNSGEVGLKVRFGKITNATVTEGLNFKIPYVDKIVKVNIKIQKADIQSSAATKDLQTITSSFVVNYSVDPKQASELYRTVGNTYQETVLTPAIQEVFKAVSASFTAEEMITKRAEVSDQVTSKLTVKVSGYGIVVKDVNIVDLDFSAEYNAAIEAKQVAEQEVKKAQQELEKTKIEAEKKVTEAQAEADALRIQKEQITDELLELRRIEAQLKAIEKWSGNMPTYYGGDVLPFIDIGE